MNAELLVEAQGLKPLSVQNAAPLDLKLAQGLVVLVGPEQARLAAYLRCLAGVDEGDGRLHLLGHQLAAAGAPDWQWLRRRVGYVTPQAPLLSILSGVRNVMLPALYHRLGREAEVFERAQALLADMTYAADHGCLPAYMSELQRHHLLIARALILQPRVLVLEQPLAGLDSTEATMLRAYLTGPVRRQVPLLVLAANDPLLGQQANSVVFIGEHVAQVFDDWKGLLASDNEEVRQYLAAERQVRRALESE